MKVYLGPYSDDIESTTFTDNERKVEVEIHKYDTWSMDHTLALIIEPMLRQLKDTKHGSAYVEPEDVPEELRPSEEDKFDLHDDTHFKRWDWVLDEMIFAFATLNSNYEEWFYDDAPYSQIESVGVGPAQLRLFPDEHGDMEDYELYEMKPNPNSKARFDIEGLRELETRMDRGFELFGKYYRGLWD
jgi:hypothetical protein